MFEHVSEKTLREILCVVHSVSATTYEAVKRRLIDLAKFRQRGTSHFRFGLGSTCREHDAPVRRRKHFATTLAVICASIQVNGFFQDSRR